MPPLRWTAAARRFLEAAHDAGGSLRYDRDAMAGDGGAGSSTGSRGSASALSERIAADPYGRSLGIDLLELGPGHCRAALTLAPHMVNFHGSPHGGVIF